MDYKKKLGFMQGRLVRSEKKDSIQFFPKKSWKKEFSLAYKVNLDKIEWTVNIENIQDNPLVNKKIYKKNLNFFKKKKLLINSVTCDFFMQRPFFKKKFAIYKNDIHNYLLSLIEICNLNNIKYIIIPLVDNSSIKTKSEENRVIDYFQKLETKLQKSQILFEIDYNSKKILKFIKKFKHKFFGINYDTGNSAANGFNLNDEFKYFKYVKNVHLKDRKKNGSSVRLGEGDFNFKFFFDYLKKKKYYGNLILQTARSKNNNHLDEIKINLEYIKKFI